MLLCFFKKKIFKCKYGKNSSGVILTRKLGFGSNTGCVLYTNHNILTGLFLISGYFFNKQNSSIFFTIFDRFFKSYVIHSVYGLFIGDYIFFNSNCIKFNSFG